MSTIIIKADDQFKKQAEEFAKSFGFRLGTLMKALLLDAMRRGEVRLGRTEIPNARTQKILDEADRDIAEAERTGDWSKFKTFDSIGEMIASQKERYGDE
jgi:antitoxin component of RelBE/YafQ-DinJ toxin-antitoxin module